MSLNSEGVYTMNTKTCMTEMNNHRNFMRYYNLLVSMILTNIKMISIPFFSVYCIIIVFIYICIIYRQPTERAFQPIQTARH